MADPAALFTEGLREDHKAELEKFFSSLTGRYTVVVKNEENFEAIESALRDFEIVGQNRMLSVLNYLQVDLSGPLLDLFFAAVNYSVVKPVNVETATEAADIVLTDYRIFGYLQTKTELGHTLIRPHETANFISALLKSGEIEFEGFEEFNRRYYVVTDSPDALKKAFRPAVLEKMTGEKDLHLEFLNGVLLAFQNRNLKADEGLRMVELFEVITREGI